MRGEPSVARRARNGACQTLIFLIALRTTSTLTRGSPLKRSSYSGFETGYHAASRLEGAIGDLDAAGRW